jgi:hypothetical protein
MREDKARTLLNSIGDETNTTWFVIFIAIFVTIFIPMIKKRKESEKEEHG